MNNTNLETHEIGLIAAIISGNTTADIIDLIKPEYLYTSDAKRVFRAIQQAKNDKLNVSDIANVASYLDAPDIDYLSSVVDYVTPNVTAYDHLNKIKERYDRQNVLVKLKKAYADIQNGEQIPNTLDQLSSTQYGLRRLEMVSASKVCNSSYAKYEKILKGELVGYRSDVEGLDNHFAGFQPGLYNIAGRPSMGKTTFSTFLAYSFAKAGYKVWYHTLEDTRDILSESLACSLLNRNYRDFRKGYISKEDIAKAFAEISNSGLVFNQLRFGIAELQTEVNIRKDEFDIIFIDQLSHIEGSGQTMREIFTKNVQGLQKIQKAGNFPLFFNAQVNRKAEERENKRPNLSDLKEAGAIEEYSDVVMFPFRPGYYDKNMDQRLLEVIIAKDKLTKQTGNRNRDRTAKTVADYIEETV